MRGVHGDHGGERNSLLRDTGERGEQPQRDHAGGLGSVAKPHVLQAAFIEEQAAQCGYCMNGMIMNSKVLLDKNPNPTEEDIKKALDPILCRCGSHLRVIRAIKRAAASARAKA